MIYGWQETTEAYSADAFRMADMTTLTLTRPLRAASYFFETSANENEIRINYFS